MYVSGSVQRATNSRDTAVHHVRWRDDVGACLRMSQCLAREDLEVNGKSIMGVLLLVAAKDSVISIACDGEDAKPCMDALTQLVNTGFGED